MKKYRVLAIILAAMMIIAMFAGCQKDTATKDDASASTDKSSTSTTDKKDEAKEEAPAADTKTVIADCLRVRKEASTSAEIVGYYYEGAKVQILETKEVDGTKWGRTSKGWISMDYVK